MEPNNFYERLTTYLENHANRKMLVYSQLLFFYVQVTLCILDLHL